MAWTNSKIFVPFVVAALDRTTAHDLDGDSFKAALFGNGITPDNTVSLANSAYGVGQWVVGGEIADGAEWPAGGVAITGNDVTSSTTTIKFDANDTASGSSATLAAVYGVLIWNDTVAGDYGVSYHYLGGTNGVTDGLLTLVYSASGILSFSVA